MLECFNLQRNGTGNGFSNIEDTFQESFSYKYQFCTKVCVSSRLVSQVKVMFGQNINKKCLICQIPIKILKQHAIPNASLQNLIIFLSKGYRRASQKWIMYITSIFQRNISLQIMGFCFDWWILSLLALKITHYLSTLFQALCSQIICMYIGDWLIWKKNVVQCCILLDLIRRISNYIC